MTNPRAYTDQLFDRLDAWRHYPAYALERRADIFFALYLPEVIEGECNVTLSKVVIPELPLKAREDNRSARADYMLTAADRQRVFLIELKTDISSRRHEQDEYLEKARARSFQALMGDIVAVASATNDTQKYYHLLVALEELGFCCLPKDLHTYLFPARRRGLTECMRGLSVTQLNPTVEVVYLQPRATGVGREIDFPCFARYVARHDDPLSQRFAQSLLRWTSTVGMLDARE